jgi:hypothetical protein
MASVEANVQPLERELIIYEKGIPELLELDTPLYGLIDKQEADPSSNRATRIPLLTQVGGTFQQVSMDGGALGSTGGPVWQVATLTPIYFTSGYSYTLLAKYATTGAARGVKSTTGEVMRLAIQQFKTYLDMLMNTAGNGVIGTITSVATNTFTLTTDGFKEELAMIGQNVQVYNAALTTNRGSCNVTAINRSAHTITVDAAPGGTVATDVLVIGGLTGTLTAQSSLFGIQYHQNDSTSGTWLGLTRSSFPSQVVTPSVNANNSALVTGMIRAGLNLIRINIGDEKFRSEQTKLVAYAHPAQSDAYEAQAALAVTIFKQPTGNQDVDLMFNQDGLKMSNVPVRQSIHQDRTRVDFLCLDYWGRIVGTDTGFVKFGDQILWPLVDTSTGALKATEQFWLNAGIQLYNRNPICGSFIKSLALPAFAGTSSIY